MRSWRALAAIGTVAIAIASCGGGEPPVARLALEPVQLRLDFSETKTVRLSWRLLRPLGETTGRPRVFVHLLDEPGEVLRTFDHPFPESWSVGATVDYDLRLHQSALGPPLAAGSYSLSVGLYDEAGKRWALRTGSEQIDDAEYLMASVQVGTGSAAPMLRFSASWGSMEPGVDRQVLGRRWLSDSGSISLSEVEAPGRLWMTLVIPDIEPGVRRLVLDPAFQETRVLLRNECAASELELTGAGRHEIELPVPVPPSGDHCRVLVEPNFYLVVAGVAEHRTVLLETLAWHPQPSVPTAR